MVKIVKVDIENETFCIKDVPLGVGDLKSLTNEIGCKYFEFIQLSQEYGAFIDEEPFHLTKRSVVFEWSLKGCILIFHQDKSSTDEKYIDMTSEDLKIIQENVHF